VAGRPRHPPVLLLNRFPLLAFGWRRQLPALAGRDSTDRLTEEALR
jgi:hypothetical protein